VRTTSGSGFDLLLAAVAVADPAWRSVMTHGEAAYDAARRDGGVGLVRDAGRFGRFGWINLLGPLAETPGGTHDLVELVEALPPGDLLRVLVGGRRAQLQSLVADGVLEAALDRDAAAQRALRRALTSERTVLDIAPWLLRADADDAKGLCLHVLRGLAAGLSDVAPPVPASDDQPEHVPAAEVVERVAPGVRYAAGEAARFVLVPSHVVAPVVVVVDEPGTTLVAHPPLEGDEPTDAAVRLRELARAAGDVTRMRILQELRTEPRTLPQLCRSLDSPRTTLLHHLALLRATGLIDITVVEGEANVYRLRDAGFDDLVQAARAFTIR
jgi:DNA-binding transcriptional ArsR family regulator